MDYVILTAQIIDRITQQYDDVGAFPNRREYLQYHRNPEFGQDGQLQTDIGALRPSVQQDVEPDSNRRD